MFSGADLEGLFGGLADAPALLLAVSGGPDSMALLALAAKWARGRGGPELHVATVDHGLRAEAAAEAALVASAAARVGIPHATLAWTGPKPATRIQERARTARYALLADHARTCGASHVLTAHHADDQAETVLMRLGRGSGLRGLGGMRRETALAPGLTLVRPLLACSKRALEAFCTHEGIGFVDDPSNTDPAYARARLRAQAGAAAELGLDRAGLNRLAERMQRAELALQAETERVEALLCVEAGDAAWRADFAPLGDVPLEILGRVLEGAILQVVGDAHAPAAPTGPVRLARLELLAARLGRALAGGLPYRATLAGARINLTRDKLVVVEPEPMRRRGRAPAHAQRKALTTSGSAPPLPPAPAGSGGPPGSLGNRTGHAYIGPCGS